MNAKVIKHLPIENDGVNSIKLFYKKKNTKIMPDTT